MAPALPASIRTTRLLLRCWSAADAVALLPVLERNVEHLAPWIPAHVATPVPLPDLAARLSGFAHDFHSDRGYRYAVLTRDGSQVLGEADLFPRDPERRVPLVAADRLELGYWLGRAATGNGFATEAMLALLGVAEALPGMMQVEIRCDPANTPSDAVPRRLGFRLSAADSMLHVWAMTLLRVSP